MTLVSSGSGANVTLTSSQTVEHLAVTVTNAAAPVAPTGYKTSAAPYLWMLVIGFALLAATVVFRRRKALARR